MNKQIMANWFERLKSKWGITSNLALVIIITVFAITGSSSMVVSNYLLNYLQQYLQLNGIALTIVKIIMVTPVYMVLLVAWGTLFGQYRFFSKFAHRMLSGIVRVFTLGKVQL